MNILLHGCNGRMGGVMTRIIAGADDAAVTCGVDARPAPEDGARRTYPVHRSFAAVTEPVDVVIDFSHAGCLGPLVGFCVRKRVALVSGTTGLIDEDRLLLDHAAEAIPVLSAPNMSLGVSLVRSLAQAAAAALGSEFDVEIVERHHRQKEDAPSGTALAIADSVRAGRADQLEYRYGRQPGSGRRQANEIGIHSLRGGSLVGEHSIIFAGPGETIEINHSALSRDLFGHGALLAARFVAGRGPGLYGIEDVVGMPGRKLPATAD